MRPASDALGRVLARRERHRGRPLLLRALAVAAGWLLFAVGVLLLWFPEVGLPIVVAGLGLLALEYDWAARWLAWTLTRWEAARRWWAELGRRWRTAITVIAVALGVVGALWLL